MNKIFLSIIAFIIITSCGKRMESSKPIHEKEAQPVYYLENDLHSDFNLHGPVHTLAKLFIRRDNNELFKNVLGLKLYPLPELVGHRGYLEFDTLGFTTQMKDLKDSLDFTNSSKLKKGIIFFNNLDSIPNSLNYEVNYDWSIIYPAMIKSNFAFTFSGDIIEFDESPDDSVDYRELLKDSLVYTTYFYELEKNKIKRRLSSSKLPSNRPLNYYEELIRYKYDSINRVTEESYTYFEKKDTTSNQPAHFTRHSHEYHNIKVGSGAKMRKKFSYDVRGNIANVEMYINNNYVFEEKYHYDEEGNLTSKERIDPRHQYHQYHRSYRMVYSFDKYGNITQLDAYNEEGGFQEQLWVDYYDFDKYNNWQRCEIFLNDTHSGEPQLTGYRRITYYEK